MKLGFELENLQLCSTNLIIVTIVGNYVLIGIFSANFIADILDPDLTDVSSRSVFNLNAFLLLIGTCFLILFIEYLPVWFIQFRAKLKEKKEISANDDS